MNVRVAIAASALLVPLSAMGAPPPESAACSVVLTETGRNLFHSLNVNDQRAFFWKQTCSSASTEVGFSASSSFAIAKRALGFSYATAEEYCNTERNLWSNYTYADITTSTVVTEAILAWTQCMKLFSVGLEITPDLASSREQFTFAIKRTGNAVGKINRVIADSSAQTKCFAVLKKPGAITIELTAQDPLDYSIPNGETFNIACRRQAASSMPTGAGLTVAKFYPETSIMLDTSEGPLTVTLPADSRIDGEWASSVRHSLAGLRSDVDSTSKLAEKLQAQQQTRGTLSYFVCNDPKQDHFDADPKVCQSNTALGELDPYHPNNPVEASIGDPNKKQFFCPDGRFVVGIRFGQGMLNVVCAQALWVDSQNRTTAASR